MIISNQSEHVLEPINLFFVRLVLGVQLILAGIPIPGKYVLHKLWRVLAVLLISGMTFHMALQ